MLNIVAEEADFLVVHKPAGLDVHQNEQEPGLTQLLTEQVPGKKLFLVHRLDKVTSGVIIVATSQWAAAELSLQFKQRTIEKYYLALSGRKPNKKQGLIKGDMKKARGGVWKLLHEQTNPAQTQFFSYSVQPGIRGFVVKPATGKTHQIRVALKSIGAPILGDKAYGGCNVPEELTEGLDRTYLHAYAVRFQWQGQLRTFKASPDSGQFFLNEPFKEFLSENAEPWNLPWPKIP